MDPVVHATGFRMNHGAMSRQQSYIIHSLHNELFFNYLPSIESTRKSNLPLVNA